MWRAPLSVAFSPSNSLEIPDMKLAPIVAAVATAAVIGASALSMVFSASLDAQTPSAAKGGQPKAACSPLLNQQFKTLQGKPIDMCDFAGRVVLVVNTASYCGFTKQYEGLQSLHDKYQKAGLVVVGFPANDFGKQEPGSNAEVADFCERTFKVKFPMVEKTSVVQGTANPLHEALAKATGDRPKWNFHKYLIRRDGASVESFGSRVEPTSPEFTGRIEKMLGVNSAANSAITTK
jgi:glutathione peroxidase